MPQCVIHIPKLRKLGLFGRWVSGSECADWANGALCKQTQAFVITLLLKLEPLMSMDQTPLMSRHYRGEHSLFTHYLHFHMKFKVAPVPPSVTDRCSVPACWSEQTSALLTALPLFHQWTHEDSADCVSSHSVCCVDRGVFSVTASHDLCVGTNTIIFPPTFLFS